MGNNEFIFSPAYTTQTEFGHALWEILNPALQILQGREA